MDILTIAKKNTILGREFLTWLWCKSEIQQFLFKGTNGEIFELQLEQKVTIQAGEGDYKDTIVSSGLMSELHEAREGLKIGKTVSQAKIKISKDELEWSFTLESETFAIKSFSTPKIAAKEKDDDPDSRFFEKIYLIEQGLAYIEVVFLKFIEIRTSVAWNQEVQTIRKWIMQDL